MKVENDAWDKLQLLRSQLKTYFKQREELVDGALAALLSGVHILIVGPPGTAKSMLANVQCSLIPGARFFYYFLNKYTTWTQLACGQVTVREEQRENGKWISFRNTEGEFLRSHIVFLDEIFESSSATLKSLLSFLNERTYTINAGETGHAPVLTVFAASNQLPGKEDEQLRAFADRFLLRYEVQYITISQEGDNAFVDMMADEDPLPDCLIEFSELNFFRAEVNKVRISRMILNLISSVRATLKLNHNIEPSDRRYKELKKVLRAYAFLNGHAQVELEDLAILEHILWTSRDRGERDIVRKVIHTLTREPHVIQAAELFREADQIYHEAADALKRARSIIPLADDDRRLHDDLLVSAVRDEQRLAEIFRAINGLIGDASPSVHTTLRSFANQVNVYRKHMVEMRGIENPFLLLPPASFDSQGSSTGVRL